MSVHTTKVAFRYFVDGKLWEENIREIDVNDMKSLVEVAQADAEKVATHDTWLIEVELLDDPDDPNRFLRFGTDTSLMTNPLGPMEAHIDSHPWAES